MRKIILLGLVSILLFAACVFAAGHSVTLTWTASPDGAGNPTLGYNIYRGTAAGAEGAAPINVAPVAVGCGIAGMTLGNVSTITVCTYEDSSVVAGATYYYTVTAVLAGNETAPSNEASAKVPLVGPTNLKVTQR